MMTWCWILVCELWDKSLSTHIRSPAFVWHDPLIFALVFKVSHIQAIREREREFRQGLDRHSHVVRGRDCDRGGGANRRSVMARWFWLKTSQSIWQQKSSKIIDESNIQDHRYCKGQISPTDDFKTTLPLQINRFSCFMFPKIVSPFPGVPSVRVFWRLRAGWKPSPQHGCMEMVNWAPFRVWKMGRWTFPRWWFP